MKQSPSRLPLTAASLVPLWLGVAVMLAGCEALTSLAPSKRIDYKSSAVAPSLELPPDLTTPRYDDRYSVSTASGFAAQGATRSGRADLLPTNAEAKIVRAGNQRWLVAKATPEQAWSMVRSFWQENGLSLALEQPSTGVMETDWAENRAEIPQDLIRRTLGRALDIFYATYKQDKFRSRIERGVEPGTVEIFVSHRGMEQVPTAKIDNSSPAGFAWAVMPPNPELEAEMLARLMVKFGAPEPAARAQVAAADLQHPVVGPQTMLLQVVELHLPQRKPPVVPLAPDGRLRAARGVGPHDSPVVAHVVPAGLHA